MFLAGIDPAREGTADEAVAAALSELRAPPRRVIEFWLEPNSGLAERAGQLLALLEESAISVIGEAVRDSQRRLQLARWFVESYANLHREASHRLATGFSDSRLIPLNPNRRPAEVENPPRRVCDEAYVQLRQLTNLSESAATAQITRDEFLGRPNDDQDREIHQVQTLHQWTRFVGEVEEDDEEGK